MGITGAHPTDLDVPGLGELGLYEPSHPTPR